MRKQTLAAASTASLVVEKFAINWPKELDMQPLFKVQVTATRSAWVYADKSHAFTDQYGRGYPARDVYRVVYIVDKTGLPPANEAYGYSQRDGYVYNSLLDVRLGVQHYSMQNQPKKRTVTSKETMVVTGDEDDS